MKERKFHEFIGLFYVDDSIIGKENDIADYLTIDLYSVVAWNQCERSTVVEIGLGERYKLDMPYIDFCDLMKQIYKT